jgi:hypothetical protein
MTEKTTGVTQLIAEEYENHRKETRLRHFFGNMSQMRCCGADEKRRYRVEVSRGTHGDPGGYWGWWNLEYMRWEMVFGSKVQVEVCFPYGSKAEEERGRGWLLPVDVKVLEKLEK